MSAQKKACIAQANTLERTVHHHSQTELSLDLIAGVQANSEFYLEAPTQDNEIAPLQPELFLPLNNPENPELSPQTEFANMPKPVLAVQIDGGQAVQFQHASNLLDSLQAQNIDVHYQCRQGYCGSCRATLLQGKVHYTQEPMAWINDGEILTCCCIPKSDIKIKL